MKKKYLTQFVQTVLCLFIFVGTARDIHSQTFFEPIIGYMASENTTYFSDREMILNDVLPDRGFSNQGFFWGGAITHYISERLSLKLAGRHTNNVLAYSDTGIAGYTAMRFKRLGLSIAPSWEIAKDLELGFGLMYDNLYNFELGFQDRGLWSALSKRRNQNQVGGLLSASYKLNSILFSLRYIEARSQHHLTTDFPNFPLGIKRTKSIEFSVAYSFKVLNSARRAEVSDNKQQ